MVKNSSSRIHCDLKAGNILLRWQSCQTRSVASAVAVTGRVVATRVREDATVIYAGFRLELGLLLLLELGYSA